LKTEDLHGSKGSNPFPSAQLTNNQIVMKSFNVIIWDPNNKVFEPYDIIPYFIDAYNKVIKNHKEFPKNDYYKIPTNFEEFKEFIKKEGHYQFWGRCEYEIILVDWPCQKTEKKIDVWEQIEMNLDLVTKIVMEECK